MVKPRPPSRVQKNVDVVCFGMVIPAVVLIVDQLPAHNTGMHIQQAAEFISDDAAIVAGLLRGWDVPSGLIGSAVGADARGRQAARELRRLGVRGRLRLSPAITTPYEVNVSDRTGHRTYFWQRDPAVLDTLDTAALRLVRGAKLLYVDWYDGEHILRPMEEAARRDVPVFLNLEHGHADAEVLHSLAPRATICQAVTDAAQRGGDPISIARKLLAAGVKLALVTMAGSGCLAATGDEMIRVRAPAVTVVDGCGAGATFSAGILYGHLRHWRLEQTVRFATAAASLKCTVIGPRAFPLSAIKRLANRVQVKHLRA